MNKITAPLTLILKKTPVGISSSTNVRSSMRADNSRIDNSNKVGDVGENLSKVHLYRERFFTPKANVAFNCLSQTFTKASIHYRFDPECHIRIKIDVSGFAISRIFSQLSLGYVTYTNPDLFIFEIC